jgi:CubicO group peptidase (beta-lactamase class C family)
MRRSLLVLPLALLVASSPVAGNELVFSLFENYLQALRRQAGIPGLAAAIVGEEAILWEGAFGLQDIESSIAVRTDTPFHVDGITQIFTSSFLLRCVEENRLLLDDRIASFDRGNAEAEATVRELLTHTSIGPAGLTFAYRPDRLAPLAMVVPRCIQDDSLLETLAATLDRFAMRDSVPGPDAISQPPAPLGHVFEPATIDRYNGVLRRLATPYSIDKRGRATRSSYPTTTLSPSGGLITTVQDLARFDIALRKDTLVRPETLAAAWTNPVSADGVALPHGLGWFVQSYNGQLVVWQFGVSENAASSLIIKVPARGLTLVMLANSDRLVAPAPLAAGDITASPMARVFLRLFVG